MRKQSIAMGLLMLTASALAEPLPNASGRAIEWESAAVGKMIEGQLSFDNAASSPQPLVIYQKNLSTPRLGRETDDAIIADLRAAGQAVLTLDYAHDAKAVSPTLNADSLKLRGDLSAKVPTLLADLKGKIDVDRVYLLAEGYRLAHVDFAQDGRRTFGMDIAYPSKPTKPVPLLLEFTCDNVNRMGAYSLLFCRDTLLDGGMYAGFAVAMADHPVAPPYKGLDNPMPQAFYRAKRAVLKAEAFAEEHGLAPTIGVIGFSRGGPFAAMLAANTGPGSVAPGPGGGSGEGPLTGPTTVRAALIHGNRYDYLHLLPNDPMADRFKKSWGDPTTQPLNWQLRGAANYLASDRKDIAPMFLNTSEAESPEYRNGLEKFHQRLTTLGVEHIYQVDPDKRGHRVTTDPKTLTAIYDFFRKHLTEEPAK